VDRDSFCGTRYVSAVRPIDRTLSSVGAGRLSLQGSDEAALADRNPVR
jgi:hypothetical protein